MLTSGNFLFFVCVVFVAWQQLCECGVTSHHQPITSKKKEVEKAKLNAMKNYFSMNSVNDFGSLGIRLEKVNKPASIMGRAGKVGAPAALMAAGDIQDATPGKCDPKPVCISNPLIFNVTSSQLAFPACLNIHRCDGCCPTNEKCVAVKSHEVTLSKVGIVEFLSGSEARYTETFVTVTNHTECQCKCQWESDADCKRINPNYVKSRSFCECECPEELTCSAYHEFDKEACACKCRRDTFSRLETSCRTRGFTWNDHFCRCDAIKLTLKEIKIDQP